jgi:hypothetical protein
MGFFRLKSIKVVALTHVKPDGRFFGKKTLFSGVFLFLAVSNLKTINVVFGNEEFEKLEKVKGTKSWHDFILTLAGGKR